MLHAIWSLCNKESQNISHMDRHYKVAVASNMLVAQMVSVIVASKEDAHTCTALIVGASMLGKGNIQMRQILRDQ